jgi:hypothetical protein
MRYPSSTLACFVPSLDASARVQSEFYLVRLSRIFDKVSKVSSVQKLFEELSHRPPAMG